MPTVNFKVIKKRWESNKAKKYLFFILFLLIKIWNGILHDLLYQSFSVKIISWTHFKDFQYPYVYTDTRLPSRKIWALYLVCIPSHIVSTGSGFSTKTMETQGFLVLLCRTWSVVSVSQGIGSGSDVDKVGVFGSSWGLEHSSSASDVISVRTTALGQVSVMVVKGLRNTKGRKISTISGKQRPQFNRPLHLKCVHLVKQLTVLTWCHDRKCSDCHISTVYVQKGGDIVC